MHLSCLSCQNQFTEECNRTTHQVSSIPAGDNLNYETEEPSSISMLIWDQNQKSACPTYESVPVVNNGSKITTNNGNSPSYTVLFQNDLNFNIHLNIKF